jgi:hypothetical protein
MRLDNPGRLGPTFVMLAVMACAPVTPSPHPQAPAPPPAPIALPPPPVPDYLPWPETSPYLASLLPRSPGDDGGVVFGGARVSLSGQLAPDGRDSLDGGQRIPEDRGGGFLFWSQAALYHAPTFLGPLQWLASLSSSVRSVSWGPGFDLVRTQGGQRFALHDRTRTVAPPSPVGLLEVASMPGGPTVGLFEDGSVSVSTDLGATWKPAVGLPPAPARLRFVDDRVWLEFDLAARRLEQDGSWTAFRQGPYIHPAPGTGACGVEYPQRLLLSSAVRMGVPLEEGVALAPVDGALIKVDLRTGDCLGNPRRIAPAKSPCELVTTTGGILAVCQIASHGAIVFSGVAGDEEPVQEVSFEGSVQFHAAEGQLIADGPCSGKERTAGVVCVRRDDGTWKEWDRRDDRWGGWLARWIPRDAGGAVGLTLEPEPAWVDASTGQRTLIKNATPEAIRSLLDRRPESVVDRNWHVGKDGHVHGWNDRRHVTIRPDRGIETSPFALATMASWGSFAFGFDQRGHAWQSLDDGSSWKEVLGPPSHEPTQRPRLTTCSAVGCELRPWLRVGWRETPPAVQVTKNYAAPLPVRVARLPKLSCRRAGGTRFLSFPLPEGTDAETPMLGFGARMVLESRGDRSFEAAGYELVPGSYDGSASVLGLRAFTHQQDTSSTGGRGAISRSTWFVEPFDPSLRVRTTQFPLRDIVASAPGHADMDEWLRGTEDGAALPVLGGKTGITSGWVLNRSGRTPMLWVGADGAATGRSYALGSEDRDRAVSRVAARGDGELLVLAEDGHCSGVVLAVGPRSSRRLFALPRRLEGVGCPANRDVLALGPNGEVGVLRTPSGDEPASAKDPALLLLPGQPMRPLAPWDTLQSADTPACQQDPSGFRAILMTRSPWVSVTDSEAPLVGTAGSMALVRWNPQRVCVEALETDAGTWATDQGEMNTSVVARFDGTPAAARVGIARGSELQIPMTCTLLPP